MNSLNRKKSRKEGKVEYQEGKNTVNKIISKFHSLSYPLEFSKLYLMVQKEKNVTLSGVILNLHRGNIEDNYKLERVERHKKKQDFYTALKLV